MTLVSSLRTRLFSLAALSLAPLGLAAIAMVWTLADRLEILAEREAQLFAHAAATHHESMVEGVSHLLHSLSALPMVRGDGPCDGGLDVLLRRMPHYRALGIATLDGRMLCGTDAFGPALARSAAAVAARRSGFALAALRDDSGALRPAGILATADGQSRMNRLVVAVMEPYWLDATAAHVGLPPDAVARLVVPEGDVLAPSAELGLVMPLPAPPGRLGAILQAIWPLRSGGASVVVALPAGAVWQRFSTILDQAPLHLALALVAALAIAAFGIHRMVLTKVDRLSAAARRIHAGEMGVVTGLGGENGEFGRLARAFDAMAGALDDRALNYQDDLRASEMRWRTLARVAPVAIFRLDLNGRCHYVNERWTDITDQPPEQALELGYLRCLHPEDGEWVRTRLLACMAAGRPVEMSHRCLRPDGRTVWVLTRAVELASPQGRALGYIGTMTDISGHKAISEALHESETRFRQALKHSRVSVFAHDLDLTYTWMFNGPPGLADVVGKCDEDVLPPDEADRMVALKRLVLLSGNGRRAEMVLTLDGQRRVLDLCLDPLRHADGRVTGIVGAAVDVTEERALQAALVEAREAAEQANQAKSRFLASASHDLRQPFQAMRLFRAALAPFLTEPPAESIAAKLDEAMTAGEELLKALLDVSTLEAGIVTPKPMPVSAAELIERLAREFQPQAEAQGLRFRARIGYGQLWTDPVLLERMLRNLLHNAVRYTATGGILLGARRRGDRLVFEVWDTGPGIAADQRAKVFEDFYQVGNPERDRSRGLGLGLSVVARTGRLLDHPVSLRSRPGRGSVFAVSVPLADGRQAAA